MYSKIGALLYCFQRYSMYLKKLKDLKKENDLRHAEWNVFFPKQYLKSVYANNYNFSPFFLFIVPINL